MKNIYYAVILVTFFAFFSCEEKLEEIGDPKGIIDNNTITHTKIIYADYDSLIQVDSSFYIEANSSSFGQYQGVKMLTLMRFFDFFADDSVVSIDSAKLRIVNDYTIGDYPTTIPLKFYEFVSTWTTDTLKNIIDQNPGGDLSQLILNMTTQQVALETEYTYEEPDTLDNSRSAIDSIYIDVPPQLIEKWYNDPNWNLKGLLLYPEFNDNIMMNLFPFASGREPAFLISYTRIDENGDEESIVDSAFVLATDVTFFDGDYPQSPDQNSYYLSSGRPQKTFVTFNYDSLPDRAVVLNGRVIVPVEFENSFFSVVRPLKGIEFTPLIYDQDGSLYHPSFLNTYFLDDIQDDYSQWALPVTYGGTFATDILQPLYNGIKIKPDSLFVKGFYMSILGNMDDYSYLKIHSAKSSQTDMKPRMEITYFIPPGSRY